MFRFIHTRRRFSLALLVLTLLAYLASTNATAVDSAGNAYVTGTTQLTNFPTANPLQAANGGFDAFLTKLNAAGSALTYSTYLGGNRAAFVAQNAPGQVFAVNSTADTNDQVCDATNCTLREAIIAANAGVETDNITFNIPGTGVRTINLTSTLPTISRPAVIDGTTQPGYAGAPLIELNGASAGAGANGLSITGGSSTVRGLVINRFSANGILLDTAGGNTIEGNYIGTNASGTAALGNAVQGIRILSPNNIVGGATPAQRNLISGSPNLGLEIVGAAASNNRVQGNYIGTNAAGTSAIPNGGPGTLGGIAISSAANNVIGGTTPGTGNVISGNSGGGAIIRGSTASNNQIVGNYIGPNAAGTALLSNSTQGQGVFIFDAPDNVVGGSAIGARNVISGNAFANVGVTQPNALRNLIVGNYIGTDAAGSGAIVNPGSGVDISAGASVTIGGTTAGAGNVISGHNGAGIILNNGSVASVVQGNFIGTNAAGTSALGNRNHGVQINNATGHVIGGSIAGARNIISGNGTTTANGDGIRISNAGATGNIVQGNFIGTDVTGTVAIGNAAIGVHINSASGNTVGGTTAAARNVISGNLSTGVSIQQGGASANLVQGNYIGTDVTGTVALGNIVGVFITNASNNTIGGTTAGAGNVISGNREGISFSTAATGNQVQGNLIGTNTAGTSALGNTTGVQIINATGNTIGGTTAAARNVISGNAQRGVFIGGTSQNNIVVGNYIGTNAAGTAAVKNIFVGLTIAAPASNNRVGGASAGERNVISGNDVAGVSIESIGTVSGPATGNLIQGNFIGVAADGVGALGNTAGSQSGPGVIIIRRASNNTVDGNVIANNAGVGVFVGNGTEPAGSANGNRLVNNSIFNNGSLGIALGGGNNNFNPIPNSASASSTGSTTRVSGSFSSIPNAALTLQFFSNPACDPSGEGEGQTLIGTLVVNTDSQGNGNFTNVFNVATTVGHVVTATATDPNNNTSEFTACAPITGPVFAVSGRVTNSAGDGVSGVNLTLTPTGGGQSRTTATDASGNYIFNNVPGGVSYTLTPARLGFSFTPPNAAISNLGNDQTGLDFTATAVADATTDLALTLTDSSDPVASGAGLTYTAAVTNSGPAAATGARLIVRLHPGVTFGSANLSGATGNCSQADNIVTCDIGDLVSGASATVQIAATPTVAGLIAAAASVEGRQIDPDGVNNTALQDTTVTGASAGSASVVGLARFNPPGVVNNVGFNFETAIVHQTGLVYSGTTAAYGSEVGVINPDSNSVIAIAQLPTTGVVNFSQVNQNTGIVYFRQGANIVVIDGRPGSPTFNRALPSLTFGGDFVLTFTLDGTRGRLYVTTTRGATPSRLVTIDADPASPTFHQVIGQLTFPALAAAQDLAVNSTTNRVYVAATQGAQGTAANGLYAVDNASVGGGSLRLIAGTANRNYFGVEINEGSNLIYATRAGNLLTALDGATEASLAEINLAPATTSVFNQDERIAINNTTGRVYLRYPNSASPSTAGSILVVDGNRQSGTFNTVLANIAVSDVSSAGDIVVDESLNRVVTNTFLDKDIIIIDGATNTVVASIPSSQTPSDVALDPITHRAFVSNQQNFVQEIDVAAATLTATIVTGSEVGLGVVNPANNLFYAGRTTATTDIVTVDANASVGGVSGLPHGNGRYLFAARNAVTNRIYVLNSSSSAAGDRFNPGHVIVIDGATNAVVANVPVGDQPFGIAINEVTNKIYVFNAGLVNPASITVIDGATNTTVNADISAFPSFTNFFNPVVNTTANKVYFTVNNTAAPPLAVLDGATNIVTPVAAVARPSFVTTLAVSNTLNRLYFGVSTDDSVHVLDSTNDAEIANIPGSQVVRDIAVNETTRRIYVTAYDDADDDSVFAIDGNTNTVVARSTQGLGNDPGQLEVNETSDRVYVSNTRRNTLAVYAGDSLALLRTVALPLKPGNLAVSAATERIYVNSLSNSDQAGVAVVSDATPAATFTIGGRVTDAANNPLANVNVNLSTFTPPDQMGNVSTTTDANGNYSFAGLTGGTRQYTVTPSLAGFTFTPPSQTFNNLQANQTANFTGTPAAFTIGGRIADAQGNAITGVTVALSGTQSATATTDGSGNYSFANLAAGGNYTVTPTLVNFTFAPPSSSFTNLQTDQTANFTGTAQGSATTNNYIINQTTGARIVPGDTDIGNHCDDCTTPVTLPFAYTLYDRTFSTARITSNGVIQFGGDSARFSNDCLPVNDTGFDYAIFGYWDDLLTDTENIPGLGRSGIFTSVTGTAPNRIFNVEWRSTFFNDDAEAINFEIRLYEGQSRFDVVYAQIDQFGSSSTVGVQRTAASGFTEYECNTGGLTPGLQLTFTGSDQLFISGLVTTADGAGISGATVSLSGPSSATVTTDASGFYSFGNLVAGGNYTVTPGRAGFTFTPPSQTFNDLRTNQTANFIGAQDVNFASITGRVVDTGGNSLGGVAVTLLNEDANQMLTTTTDAGGNYSFTVPAGSDYTVTPSSSGFTFDPSFRTFLNLSGSQVGNFVGTGALTINGQIANLAPGQIVTVVLSGARSSVTPTNANGTYSFAGLPVGGDYTVTPVSNELVFNPPSVIVNDLNNNMTINFTASPNPNPTPTPPIVEGFEGATRDPVKFSEGTLTQPPGSTDPQVSVVQQNGQLLITPRSGVTDASFNGYVTARAVDFTNANAAVQVVQTTDNGAQTIFGLGSSSENFFRFVVQEADPDPAPPSSSASFAATRVRPAQTGVKQLIFQVRQAGSFNALPIPYDPVQHRFWRFRHDAVSNPATMNFETSPTGAEGTYTVRFMRSLGGPIGSLATELAAGTAGAIGNPGQAIFDTLDVQPQRARALLGAFSFAAGTVINVNEGVGSLRINVRRTGSTTPEAAVEVASDPFDREPCNTVDGKARPRCDYSTTVARPRFAPGETEKTITIFITDDSYQEGVEEFRIALGNATGGYTVEEPLAIIRITDNDGATGPNPINTAPYLVRQQYLDFLYREPEASGFQAWVGVLQNCAFGGDFGPGKTGSDPTCDRITVSSSFFRSKEFQIKGYFVYRFYKASLGRVPTYEEFLRDMASISSGQTDAEVNAMLEAFAGEWVKRADFRARTDGLTNEGYIDYLAATAGVTLSNRAQLIGDLNAGRRTRAGVLRVVVDNEELFAREFNAAFVLMQYFGYLQRDPDAVGFQRWLDFLNTTGDFRTMIFGFLYSQEYLMRFGPA